MPNARPSLFRQLLDTSPALNALMLKFVRSFELQIASTVSANGRAKLEERLARWLLMVHDRVDSYVFHITMIFWRKCSAYGGYGKAEAHYKRLFGQDFRRRVKQA